jgi:hypothetical protein
VEATTVKTEFGMLRNNYRSKQEFIEALKAEYCINQIDGNIVFSRRDRDFIILDWTDFCDNKPKQTNNNFYHRGLKLPIVNAI